MSNNLDPLNNMVESKKNSEEPSVSDFINTLSSLTMAKITAKDIEFDISQIEKFTEGWLSFNEEKKKNFILKNLERDIRKNIYEEEIDTDKLSYEKLKALLTQKYGKPAVSMTEYFTQKQMSNECVEDFVRRMEKDGMKLKLTGKVRMEVIRLGITRYQKALLQILNGEKRISEELIDKLKGQEALEKKFTKVEGAQMPNRKPSSAQAPGEERKWVCFSCGKSGHIARYCRSGSSSIRKGVNNIEEEIVTINKEPFIYISSLKLKPIFDTGSNDNYITKSLVAQLGLKTKKKQISEKKYTCLGQPFFIKEDLYIEFSHKGKKWKEIFNILPGRPDQVILLGKKWINRMINEINDCEETGTLEELKSKLFVRNPGGIKANYACPIECKEEDRITESASMIPQAIESKVDKTLETLLDLGYIKPSNSSWCNRIRPVEKGDNSIRLTTNLIKLNQKVPLDRYSLPRIEEIIHNLHGYKYFSKIDLKDGFFQIPLRKEDTHKTAFRIKNRLYEWTRMPQGFKNSPAVFQRFMDITLKDEIGKGCYVYVDDIIVLGKTEEEHDDILMRVLKKLTAAGLQGNKEKCIFKQQEIEFLGHKLSENTVKPLNEITDVIKQFIKPGSIEEVRRFLGLVNYYRKFISGCADLIEPISKLLRKDVEFKWDSEQEEAFERIKEVLNSQSVLIQPNYEIDFILETDASNTGLGAILAQEYNGEIRPIAYASRSLTYTERNYSITEKEMLGAIWAMEHFKYYLYGRQFVLKTDHKALEAFNTKGFLESARIQRWMERIQMFNFRVEYQKGETIEHVDALSRQFMDQAVNEIRNEDGSLENVILKAHEDLIHRGAKAVQQQLIKQGCVGISESEVKKVLKDCKKCKMYNPIRTRASKIVEAFSPGERVGFDIIELGKGSYILVAIDYFSRKGFAIYSLSKRADVVLKFLKKIHEQIKIKTLVTDEGRENFSQSIKNWLVLEQIDHHMTSPYHHQSNGRVERLNRTIRESLNKLEMKGLMHSRVLKVITVYNETYHRIIGMTPNEAIELKNAEKVKRNQYEARITENMNFLLKGDWPLLKIGDKVLIKDELRKSKKGPRFKTEAVVKEVLDFNTYKLEKNNKVLCKRHISQLKSL